MSRIPSPCAKPGCHRIALGGSANCEQHQRPAFQYTRRAERLPKDWRARRQTVLARDNYLCRNCGAPANEVDHRVAGDDHSLDNLQALCTPCHRRKTAWEGVKAQGYKGAAPF